MNADHTIKAITKTDPEVSQILTDLRRENAMLREQLSDKAARVAELEAEVARLNQENAAKDARIAELEEALEELMDWQNGPPLATYRGAWNAAMAEATRLLGYGEWEWMK